MVLHLTVPSPVPVLKCSSVYVCVRTVCTHSLCVNVPDDVLKQMINMISVFVGE